MDDECDCNTEWTDGAYTNSEMQKEDRSAFINGKLEPIREGPYVEALRRKIGHVPVLEGLREKIDKEKDILNLQQQQPQGGDANTLFKDAGTMENMAANISIQMGGGYTPAKAIHGAKYVTSERRAKQDASKQIHYNQLIPPLPTPPPPQPSLRCSQIPHPRGRRGIRSRPREVPREPGHVHKFFLFFWTRHLEDPLRKRLCSSLGNGICVRVPDLQRPRLQRSAPHDHADGEVCSEARREWAKRSRVEGMGGAERSES